MRAATPGDAFLGHLSKFLHVRRSEMGRTTRTAGLALVLGWAMYLAFNSTQAIFLSRAGAGTYPLFFVLVALTVWPVVLGEGFLSRRLGPSVALRLGLAISALAGLAISLAYGLGETPRVALAAYLVFTVCFEAVYIQFWNFAARFFDLLEAKRILPVVAAGSSIGYILAGLTTNLVARLWATEPLVLFWSGGCLLTIWLTRGAEKRLFRPGANEDQEQFMLEAEALSARRIRHPFAEALRYLRVSALVRWLVVLAFVLLMAMRVGDYLAATVFVRSTHSLSELTVLISDAWTISYVVQLVLALFVTPWILNRFGVRSGVLTMPIAVAAGFAALAAWVALPSALFLFVVRNGVQTGVDDPVQNLVGAALPEQTQPRLRVLLDALVLPGATILAGAALLAAQLFNRGLHLELLALAGIGCSALLIVAAVRVRLLYVNAVYDRLRTHAVSLADFEQALGRPTAQQVTELEAFLHDEDAELARFSASVLARLAPARFGELVPELAQSPDHLMRRLAFQLAPAEALTPEHLDSAASDRDGWVVAAAAISGLRRDPNWQAGIRMLDQLAARRGAEDAAAVTWVATQLGDEATVVAGLSDRRARVRLEAIRSFATLKGGVRGAADPLIACLRDRNREVRHAALNEAIRWAPPAGDVDHFAAALLEGLTNSNHTTRRLAGEAIAIQVPEALDRALPLLNSRSETAAAVIEALVRSGRPALLAGADNHLRVQIGSALVAGRLAALLRGEARSEVADARHVFLRICLQDFVDRVVTCALAYMRALHARRGWHTVERGLGSAGAARAEAVETLLNFGPGWLVEPLARLLDPEGFESPGRALTASELALLEAHPDRWVRQAAQAVGRGLGERMKDLIALKRVPLFSTLNLDQLAAIDRVMVTRRYLKGETICRMGDLTSEMYVVVEGDVRIHRDEAQDEVTLAHLGSSDFFGEMSLFDEHPRSAGAVATVDSVVRVLRKDRLHAITQDHPEVLLEVIRNLSERLREANSRWEATMRINGRSTLTPEPAHAE